MPPSGAGGGRPSSLDGLAPCDVGAKGRGRPGARTGEGAGNGLKMAQLSEIHLKPPPGAGGGSEAGEGVGIGILAERNDKKPPPGAGGGRPSSLDGLAPCDVGAKGRGRTGARTGEGAGKGLLRPNMDEE